MQSAPPGRPSCRWDVSINTSRQQRLRLQAANNGSVYSSNNRYANGNANSNAMAGLRAVGTSIAAQAANNGDARDVNSSTGRQQHQQRRRQQLRLRQWQQPTPAATPAETGSYNFTDAGNDYGRKERPPGMPRTHQPRLVLHPGTAPPAI